MISENTYLKLGKHFKHTPNFDFNDGIPQPNGKIIESIWLWHELTRCTNDYTTLKRWFTKLGMFEMEDMWWYTYAPRTVDEKNMACQIFPIDDGLYMRVYIGNITKGKRKNQ